jgi:prepilin-type N-terminal cleavage/methylation domain-containing protein
MSHRRIGHRSGFTLVETLVAMFIMAVGMLGVAALMSQMSGSSINSRYMSTEALLASEKLEDLSRYNSTDPNLAAGGNVDLTKAAAAGYSDQIQVSTGTDGSPTGDIKETFTGTDVNGTYYVTISHSPNGTAQTSDKVYANPPAPTSDMASFGRRWLIEANTPVAGVRRITVLVNLTNAVQGQQATFQMSMVRP